MARLLALALALTVAAGCSRAAEAPQADLPPLRLRAQVDHTDATIYDPITLTIRVDYAEAVTPELPEAPPVPAGMELDKANETGPDAVDNRRVLTRTYTMHATHPGSFIVPSLTVAYTLADGTKADARTPRMFVTVKSLLGEGKPDLAALRDPKPPVAIPRDYTTIYGIVAAVAAGTFLGAALLALWLRRRRTERELAPEPALPPHEAALAALARLERGPLLAQGRVREYVYELDEVFRAYLERRFRVPAIASTSEQLLDAVRAAPRLPSDTSVFVKRFVRETDPIKFSDARGDGARVQQWTRDIRTYVERTKPEPELEVAA